jgi:hypothetical protein
MEYPYTTSDSVLNRLQNFLDSTATPTYMSTNGDDVMEELRRSVRRRKRRGEPRKSARGHITRFAPHGRWISVREKNGSLQALHATKGWRVVPSGMADLIRARIAAVQAQKAA